MSLDPWHELWFQADLLRLDTDVAALEKLADENPVIPSKPDERAEAAWARLMARVS